MALYKVLDSEKGYFQGLNNLLKGDFLCESLAKTFISTDNKNPTPRTIDHLPWMIPILGSGALEGVGSWDVSLEQLLIDVGHQVESFGASPDGSEAFATIASRFVRSLVKGRRRHESPVSNVTKTRVEVTRSAARLALVTALLTRYCHVVRAMDPAALDRSSDEIIELPETLADLDDPYHFSTTVRAPLVAQLKELRLELKGDEKYGSLTILIDALISAFDRDKPSVSMNWARLLTEATWLKLVDRPDAYYGWSELMLNLFLVSNVQGFDVPRSGDTSSIRLFGRRARYSNFTKVGDLVGAAFEGPTQWSAKAASHSPVHSAVAQILIRQAAQSGRTENPHLPRAMAISTAFDLELELSLWRSGSGYQVAVPLHAFNDEGMAELVWMVGTVDPNEDPDIDPLVGIRNPKSWAPLSAKGAGLLRKDLPLILRVTGCPLVSIKGACAERVRSLVKPPPVMGGSQRVQGRPYAFAEGESVFVSHAVSVDEYLAIRLAEAEIQRAYESLQADTQQRAEVSDVGQAFAGSPRNPTYFAFLGVPFADPSVRQRLMSLLTVRWIQRAKIAPNEGLKPPIDWDNPEPAVAPAATEPDDEGPVGPSSLNGIAMNTRLDLEEAALLSWLGLSVVHGDCSELVPHLLDYASHVCDDEGAWHQLHSSMCTVRNPA